MNIKMTYIHKNLIFVKIEQEQKVWKKDVICIFSITIAALISYTYDISVAMVTRLSHDLTVGEEFALHADICNLGSGFLATDYIMSFLQSPGTQGQNMRPNRLSHIYIIEVYL